MNDEPKKIFTLQPVEDDFKKRVVRAREIVCEDHQLTYGARVLYCRLVDLGFLDSFTLELGAVDMRFSELSRRLGCSDRVLANWRDELTARGHVWCSQKLRRNMYPSTIWHVSAMDPPKIAPASHLDRDGGAPFAPYLHKSNVFKTRGKHGRFESSAAASGTSVPLPAVNSAAASGTGVPLPAVDSAAASGTSVPLPAEQACGLMESPRLVTGKGETQNVQRCNASAPKLGKNGSESGFLAEVREVFDRWQAGAGAVELATSGGWWRKSYREKPRKAAAVLADISCLVKEGKILDHPGKAAVDLWKRLP